MFKNLKTLLVIVIAIIAIVGAIVYLTQEKETPLSNFGKCLSQNGFKYYGAYWCPACAQQNEILGQAKKHLYTECAVPGSESQAQECVQKGIRAYPTWIINDEEKIEGIQSIKSLSELSGCSF